MHELLKHVLTERDLTRAGDLFSIPDSEIVDDLNEVLKQITEISSRPDYVRNDHDQALIEICVTRVTSCVKETGTLEKYCSNLVALLESCLHHNLMPIGHLRDDDPPHAKIASDVIACIVLVSFPIQSDKEISGNKAVMELFLPVAVQFLHKGNREISRHMARYLSLAAVHHAMLLKPHVQTIMDSIMTGNYPLSRILTNLYEVCPEPLEGHVMALVSLLPHAEQVEKNSLFALFEQIAARRPEALKTCVPQLLSYLCPHTTPPNDPGCMCVDILQLIVCLSRARVSLVLEHGAALRLCARGPHASAQHVALAAAALAQIGCTSRDRAQETLNFILESMSMPGAAQAALLRECTTLCSAYPALFTERVLNAVRANHSVSSGASSTEVNRTSGGVTIVKLGGAPAPAPAAADKTTVVSTGGGTGVGYTRRVKLGDSRSTGRLHPPAPRSMTTLHVAGGSVSGLHKSMTRLSSSQQINSQPTSNPTTVSSSKPSKAAARAPRSAPHTQSIVIGPSTNSQPPGPTIITNPAPLPPTKSTDALPPVSVTHVTPASPAPASHRISVFEPYPMRDTVQHFCEKHLDKIKAYMDMVSLRLPPPAKCTIEERRSKKQARLQFACGTRGPHCLYSRTLFTMRTRAPRVWIHLMFLALQARHAAALSSRDASVASLKHCWDILKCENKTFLTLVTSAFPGIKEQEMLLNELRVAGFFDVFSLTTPRGSGAPTQATWGCFLCTHPERAPGFLQPGAPVIEGTLREKKGRWRLFRRWRTRYFTLSGAHLSVKGSSGGESIDINQIRSVKVSRGARNIPKAFEIFTGDQTLILKPAAGDAEQWAQCLSIAVASSQARHAPAKANSLPARGLTLKSF